MCVYIYTYIYIYQPYLFCKTNDKINNRINFIFFIAVLSIKRSVAQKNIVFVSPLCQPCLNKLINTAVK